MATPVPDDELDGGDEGWIRDGGDLELVEAYFRRELGGWQVGVAAMELVRSDPLESELRQAVEAALRAVPGVSAVHEEDREVWVVFGQPSGARLVDAVAAVVDARADDLQRHLDSL